MSPGILLPLYFGASESIMGHYLLVLPTHPDPTTFLVTIPRHRTAESIFHIFFFFFKDLNKNIACFQVPSTHPDWVSLRIKNTCVRPTAHCKYHFENHVLSDTDTETTFLRPSKSLESEMSHSVQWPRFSLNHVAETPARSS